MKQTVVIDVVGLTPAMMGDNTPNLNKLAADSSGIVPVETVTPAVTTTVQSTFATGVMPAQHGIVANGWYYRDLSEIWFWRQSNRLVQGEKIWEAAKKRNPDFTCAKLFWWYNMYADVDWAVTPRPMYPADGRKIPDIHTHPASLRNELNDKLGQFPLFKFWGPAADIVSSQWIADCAVHMFETRSPTLTLVYMPHLDYNLQKLGPSHPDIGIDVARIDAACGQIIDAAAAKDAQVIVVSEYGITEVSRPVHINRALREAGHITIREELGRELLDAGASSAFAVADHQVAHIYVANPAMVGEVKSLVESLDGVERVLDTQAQHSVGLDHERSGELVAIADANAWFTYYHFFDDDRAPDYARTVDIHRKPGFDPVELYTDPEIRFIKAKVGLRLAQKILGFRYLMDVIPLDATLVKGSHGRPTDDPQDGPLLISNRPQLVNANPVAAVDIKNLILDHVFAGPDA